VIFSALGAENPRVMVALHSKMKNNFSKVV